MNDQSHVALSPSSHSYKDPSWLRNSTVTLDPGGFPGGSDGKESACNAGDWGLISGQEDPLEKEMASILAWRIPRTEEPGGL